MSRLSINQAARQLGLSPSTLRRWIAQGAPTVSLGAVGRGRGSVVDIEELRRWRYGEAPRRGEADTLALLAQAFLDFFRCNSGIDQPAHRSLGIPDREASALLLALYGYTARRISGRDLDEKSLPPQIAHLRAICLG